MANFGPDEDIISIRIQVHTANVSGASTDSDIFVELFDPPPGFPTAKLFWVEIDTDGYNDFEAGDTKWYDLPSWYFGGRIVNDIIRICLHKGDDWGSDWGLGWISLWVNGKEFFTGPDVADPDNPTWLSDGEHWCASFPRVEFVAPMIQTLGLPDAASSVNYSVRLTAIGGRKPITWKLTASKGGAFSGPPTISAMDQGVHAIFAGHTASTPTALDWSGTIMLTDVDGRTSSRDFAMRTVFVLPAPTIQYFTPEFGWPGLSPAEPTPVVVTITSQGKDFDSRNKGATTVFFQGPAFNHIEATVVEITSSQARVEVPAGAISGILKVQTAFGEALSAKPFTVHPNGVRFIDGFSFHNDQNDNKPELGFPSTFAWERYEQTFGLDEMWLVVFDQAIVPNPISTFFYLTTKDMIDNGCCHGFCLTALQMRHGIIPTTGFAKSGNPYPLDDTLWDLAAPTAPSAGLSNYIQNRQLVVWSDEGLSFFLAQIDSIPNVDGELCEMDARIALNHMQQALAAGLADPCMIAFAKNCLPWIGHVVMPYNVEPDGSRRDIRVYDPNRPAQTKNVDDEGSVFWVDPGSGDWGYTFGSTSDRSHWNGLYMFTIPLTEYGHQTDWSLPGLSTLIGTAGTFMLGCVGTDGDGEIVQVQDSAGRTLFNEPDGMIRDRTQWPEGVRLFPQFSSTGQGRKLFAITKAVPLVFTVRPRPNSVGLFSLTLGSSLAFTIEDVAAPLEIHVEVTKQTVQVAPVQGKTSAILRLSKRLANPAESLSYAVRLHEISAGKPIALSPSADGLGAVVKASDTILSMDVEVTHTSRIGEVRILESDGIEAPGRAVASFHVSSVEELDQPGKMPLVFDLDPDGTGHAVKRMLLGQHLEGLTVVAPHRVVIRRPLIVLPGQPPVHRRTVAIDVSRSTTAFANQVMRFRALAASRWGFEAGKVLVDVERGSHVFRIVAEDDAGHRSFPRTVMVTDPEPTHPTIPSLTLFSENTTATPGATLSLLLGTYVIDTPTVGIAVNFNVRERLSGLGGKVPELFAGGFALSPELQAAGAQVKTTGGGITLRCEIRWDTNQPRSGRIDLGHLQVRVPADMPLGSTFVLRSSGFALSREHNTDIQHPVNGLPALVRVWGGAEPVSLHIEGPSDLAEQGTMKVSVTGQGVPAHPGNVGWWTEKISGHASVRQDPENPATAVVTGIRAGWVRLKTVVGTHTAESIIRVTPTVRPRFVGISAKLRSIRMLEQAIGHL